MDNIPINQHLRNMSIRLEMDTLTFEAESVAFIVSLRLGLDTSRYSMSYIKSWLKDKEELKIIADSVQKIAYTIITELAESSDSAFSMLKEESEE